MNVSIIGLGLIGGSLGLALREQAELKISGWDADENSLGKAKSLGIVSYACGSLEEAIAIADDIYLAIPVHEIELLLPSVLDRIRPNQRVFDLGSTKEAICENVKGHPNRGCYLAAHPIAGTEYSGPGAAFPGLYKGKVMITCDLELTEKSVQDHFISICDILGMKMVSLSAKDHDRHLAYVSHLSHAIAFGLSNTVLDEEKDDNRILELAGSGFASTVRLAKSSPDTWVPIFLKNRKFVLEGLDRYLAEMQDFRDRLDREDVRSLHDFLTKGREIRKILE